MRLQRVRRFRRILVPTDFSNDSRNAAEYAVQLARHMDCRLLLFHAIHIPVLESETYLRHTDESASEQQSLHQLKVLRNQLIQESGFSKIDIISESGLAVDQIVQRAKLAEVDLVVMGTAGANGFQDWVMGSYTAEVIARCNCPVLAVPASSRFREIRKVIFATNYADNDFRSVYLLTQFVRPFDAAVIIAHVEQDMNHAIEEEKMNWFRKQVLSGIPYDKISFELLKGDSVSTSLESYQHTYKADMIVTSMRHRNFFDRLTSRSLSKHLVQYADVPVLVFHAQLASGTPVF